MKVATCDYCGSDEVWLDAYVDVNGELVHSFDNAYCGGECDGDIKYSYTITEINEGNK